MNNFEFSAQKFREILLERVKGKNKKSGMQDHPEVYWEFYAKEQSPLRSLNELSILRLTDEEIMEAYAKWRIES